MIWLAWMACTSTRYAMVVPAVAPPVTIGAPLDEGTVAVGAHGVLQATNSDVSEGVIRVWVPAGAVGAHARLGVAPWMELAGEVSYAPTAWLRGGGAPLPPLRSPLLTVDAGATFGRTWGPGGFGGTVMLGGVFGAGQRWAAADDDWPDAPVGRERRTFGLRVRAAFAGMVRPGVFEGSVGVFGQVGAPVAGFEDLPSLQYFLEQLDFGPVVRAGAVAGPVFIGVQGHSGVLHLAGGRSDRGAGLTLVIEGRGSLWRTGD